MLDEIDGRKLTFKIAASDGTVRSRTGRTPACASTASASTGSRTNVTVERSQQAFEELVAEALDEIPEPFASHLDNVHVVVEDEPSAEHLGDVGDPHTLFGLYEGVPQTERGPGYSLVMPDKITIFRGPICRACADEDEVYEEVAVTVVHEIAHHFGIDDERLDELGW